MAPVRGLQTQTSTPLPGTQPKYGGAGVSELKRLRELEAENAKLKRMYADLALENTAIKDVLSRKL